MRAQSAQAGDRYAQKQANAQRCLDSTNRGATVDGVPGIKIYTEFFFFLIYYGFVIKLFQVYHPN